MVSFWKTAEKESGSSRSNEKKHDSNAEKKSKGDNGADAASSFLPKKLWPSSSKAPEEKEEESDDPKKGHFESKKSAESGSSFLTSLWSGEATKPVADGEGDDTTRKNDIKKIGTKTEATEAESQTQTPLLSGLWRRNTVGDKSEGAAKHSNGQSGGDSVRKQPREGASENSTMSRLSLLTSTFSIGKNSERTNNDGGIITSDDAKLISVAKQMSNSPITVNSNRPSIYEESLEMLTGALLIYTFADLRQMAREGIIESTALLQSPIRISQVMDAIRNHKGDLEERAKKFEDMADRLATLKDIHDQQLKSSSLIGSVLRGSISTNDRNKESVLSSFHDEKSTQGMVYGIAVNCIRKRITVIFRGSVTQQDFITDAKWSQKKLQNPVHALAPDTSAETIQVHTGFYEYLFRKDDKGRVRLEHILEDVKALLKENPGYRCYCTGHSLGAALATLCGFYAAQDKEIVKNGPVVVISIASPRVGNKKFRWAFQTLERLQRLQHLRISNKEDLVTLMPFLDVKATAFSPLMSAVMGAGNVYKHCGINLECTSVLDKDETSKPFNISYVKDQKDEEGAHTEELKRSLSDAKALFGNLGQVKDVEKATAHHSCDEYEARLTTCKKFLETVTLDQLYSDETIVGAAIASSYRQATKK